MKKLSIHLPLRVECALFLLLWFSFSYVHQFRFDGPTAVSRLDLLHSLVVHGTVRIDAYHRNTPDKARHDGHYYSDKAPGTVVLALAPFSFAVAGLGLLDIPLDSKTGWLISSWTACAGSIAVVAALGGVALFCWIRRWVDAGPALLTTLALFLGAAPLPYSTMMFSHALVIGLLAIAIWALDRQQGVFLVREHPASSGLINERRLGIGRWMLDVFRCGREFVRANRWDLGAGLACGWALASEYSAGLIVAGLLIWLLTTGGRRTVPFCLAAVPPLLLIPAYNWACFGDLFTLPYSVQASFPQMKEGLYAIKWPDAETALKLLLSPARGLLFWTPFLVMAFFGYPALATRSLRWFWLAYAAPLVHVIVISGRTWDWTAGPTLGPRLLAPILPLLALPCALGVKRFPKLGFVLAVLSIGMTILATLTNATPNTHLSNPLSEVHWDLFSQGRFCPNLGMAIGLPPFVSFLLYALLIAGSAAALWFGVRVSKPSVAIREMPAKTNTASIRVPDGMQQ